ncbi:translocation/assembly module TamB domain-containing protein [Lysobacter solisilvae (ex Woo and Kim 2020)]|uniref:Dicarboxylate transport domain-containing protein n=1 Tax=Agrilutibacter terrestris TaxID=2865112 RepID=A0A7H0FY82_9GAMM|nr:hypothetical protein [Lysobacter terrestris]QNP40998.1 hypothetical protein H8B22_01765 [Lysobacter terrestris]
MTARIAQVTTPVATLQGVEVRLDWPQAAPQGTLHLRARRVDAPDLGYRFADLAWQCPLQRDGNGGWRCAGELRSGRAAPLHLALDLGVATTAARLSRGTSALSLQRDAATPDRTEIDLVRVPLAWAQALLAAAWDDARITGGTLDGRLDVIAPAKQPLRVEGPLRVSGGAFDTPDGTIAAENVGADLTLALSFADRDRAQVRGGLHGGELLLGNAYVSLQQRAVAVDIEATQQAGRGWQLPRLRWYDDGVLRAEGRAALTPDGGLAALDLQLRSPDLAPLRDAYLSGWLGVAGLAQLQFDGAADATLSVEKGTLQDLRASLHGVSIVDPEQRFGFDRLDGNLALSAGASVDSELAWQGGQLYGLRFGAARLPFASNGGALHFREPVSVPMLGGQLRFDHLALRPPAGDQGLDVRFGMTLAQLDVGQLAKALDWPAFTGELSGEIPLAHYASERLDFDGGLRMRVFDGAIEVSSLSMERPFGVAPTLSADVAMDDLDLEALTGVFGFGSITGRLDGRIDALRMVDWQPVAFDAMLHTQRKPGVRQRISQRAVQDLSSVGDASFTGSLQSQLIGLFDDFGYSRIGISCRLADDVCSMDGLGSAGRGFIIVAGSGLPRLTVVGFNRRVDWPTLVERLGAIGKGDVKPVVE